MIVSTYTPHTNGVTKFCGNFYYVHKVIEVTTFTLKLKNLKNTVAISKYCEITAKYCFLADTELCPPQT